MKQSRAGAWTGGNGVRGRIVDEGGMAVVTLGVGRAVLVESGSGAANAHFGVDTGSRIAPERRSPVSEGYGAVLGSERAVTKE